MNRAVTQIEYAPDDPERVYAAGHCGIARSTDGGKYWTLLSPPDTPAGTPVGNHAVNHIAVGSKQARRRVLVACGPQNVWMSRDDGKHWLNDTNSDAWPDSFCGNTEFNYKNDSGAEVLALDPGDPNKLVSVLKISGTDASVLIVGTTTTDFEKFADHPAADADNLDLTTYGSLDDSTVIQTVFAQPVTTIFVMERGANDSGFFQALDADGNPTGEMVAFTAADFQLPDAGLKIVGQDAGGIEIRSDVPIGGLVILPPEGGVHSIDPASISAIPAP